MWELTSSAPGIVYAYPSEPSWFTILPAIIKAASMLCAFDRLANYTIFRCARHTIIYNLTD